MNYIVNRAPLLVVVTRRVIRQGPPKDEGIDKELSEEANYRDTIRVVRSFMGWQQIPDFVSSSSSLDDNPFVGARAQPAEKVSIKLLTDEWLCRKLEKLNLTMADGYPYRISETAGLLRDQFIKMPRSSKCYDMYTEKKDSKVLSWSPDPAKPNSSFSRVARHSLPCAAFSRSINQDTLRRWERSARKQTFMCNQTAGLSHCLTRVQDSMVGQLKTLHHEKGKGKSSERSQHAAHELDYLVTFNRSITQDMAHPMQDLSEGIFINMANLKLACCDSYLDYLRAEVKQDTLTSLCTAPLHMNPFFLNQSLAKAEEEISRNEERHSSSTSQKKPGRYHPSCFFNCQGFSPTGPEVRFAHLEANQGQATGQERAWQGFNLPAEAG